MTKANMNGAGGGIPLPIVALNRWMLVIGVSVALILQQPWIIALLFLILVSAVALGPKGSLPFQVGSRLLARKVQDARKRGDVEDRRLMRFNNSIAIVIFGLALIGFGLGYPLAGWILSAMVSLAAAIGLCGFCIGCFLFYRFRLAQFRRGRTA